MKDLYIDLSDYIVIHNKEKYSIQTNEWESFPTYYSNKKVKNRCIVNYDLNKTVNIDNKLVWENVYDNLKYFYRYKVAYIKNFPWKQL